MNEKVKKGCGIGCGVFTILIFVIIGSIAFFVRDMSADYKAVSKVEKELIAAYGGLDSYTPKAGGLPSPDRVQLFVEIRKDQAEWRHNVSTAFEDFLVRKETSSGGGFKHFLKLLRSTTEMAPSLAGFWSSRNAALIDRGMGMGEYSYIYCLAYFSYLGYDPGDGAHDSNLDFGGSSGSGLEVSTSGAMTEEQRRDAAWSRVHDLMLPMLESIDPEGMVLSDDEARKWLAEVELEVGMMQESLMRYPWRDGAPRALSDVFRPYRKDLEEQYDISVNPVELIFEKFDTDEE